MGVIINPRAVGSVSCLRAAQLSERLVLDSYTGADAILETQLLPAGLFAIGTKLKMSWQGTKAATTNGVSFHVRLGQAGTTADQKLTVAVIFLATASQSCSTFYEIIRLDATTVRILSSGAITPQTGSTVTPAQLVDVDYSVGNGFAAGYLDGPLYFTLSVAVTTETYTNRYFGVEMR